MVDYKDIFISYRRDTGSTLANIIKTQVETKSTYTCFLDIDNLNAGDFRDKLEPNVKYCKAILIVITAQHLERCAIPNDVCVQELELALKYGKKIIIVTELQRSKVRALLGSIKGLPKSVKDLGNFNMFYMRAGDAIHETIGRIIESMQEDTLETLETAAKVLKKSVNYPKLLSRIYICMYEFDYDGMRVGDYLVGKGKLTCRDNIDIVIEGNFNCSTSSISGTLKVTYDGAQVFAGVVSKITSLRPLRITGSGVFENNGSIYTGNLKDGLPTGQGTLYTEITNIKYTGYFEDGLKHGHGVLYLSNDNCTSILTGTFTKGKPYGECLLMDTKYNTIIRFHIGPNKLCSNITLALTKGAVAPDVISRENAKKVLKQMQNSIFTIHLSDTLDLQDITVETEGRVFSRHDYTSKGLLKSTIHPKDGIIREVKATSIVKGIHVNMDQIRVTTAAGYIDMDTDSLDKFQDYVLKLSPEKPWDENIVPYDQMDYVTILISDGITTLYALGSTIQSFINFIKLI